MKQTSSSSKLKVRRGETSEVVVLPSSRLLRLSDDLTEAEDPDQSVSRRNGQELLIEGQSQFGDTMLTNRQLMHQVTGQSREEPHTSSFVL
jgi:hypothetical protein